MAERGSLDQLPSSTLGQYQIRSRLGSGGMGDVYDAVHTSLDKRVAIKTLRKRFLEDEIVVARFLREGQLASRMRHPNIVDITDVGMIDGMPCLVMEHLEGDTLSEVIKRGPLAPNALVDLLLPIIAAVDFAHDHGVLHRDLKPSNIFLARSWNGELTPKVLDFGISKLVSESTEAALTTDSAFIGTPHYASPEAMRADKSADRRADLYSMGVILYEGVSGVRPFADKGANFVAMAMAICAGDYPPLPAVKPDVPEGFVRIVQRAMALRADERFLTMRHLGEALLPFASDRARLIWEPTFKNQSAGPAIVPETHVLPEPSMTAVMPNPISGTGPAHAAAASWPAASVPPLSSSHPSGNTGMRSFPGGAGPSSMSGNFGHTGSIPPGMHDRTPSFGAGTGTPFSSVPQPKSNAPLFISIAAVVVGVGVVGAVVMTKRHAPTPQEVAAASAGDSFVVDVQTIPETAVIEVDGAAAGTGHLVRQFARDKQTHVLRVSAAGYETLLTQFDEQRPPPSQLALRATPVPTVIGVGSSAPTGPQKSPITGPAQGGGKGGPKGKTDRPRTDNIDPWE